MLSLGLKVLFICQTPNTSLYTVAAVSDTRVILTLAFAGFEGLKGPVVI